MTDRAQKACGICRQPGHYRQKCPMRAAPRDASLPIRAPLPEELAEVFDLADEMVGGGDPELADETRARIARVRRQVWRALGY